MHFFSLLNAQPLLQTYKTSHNDLLPYKKSQNNNNNKKHQQQQKQQKQTDT